MRWVSINQAVFLFMGRGEKLQLEHYPALNYWPDQRYVLWPRGRFWDVRYFHRQGDEWLPIADEPFSDEPAAWQAAYAHWGELAKTIFKRDDKGGTYNEMMSRIPVIGIGK
ncbi:TPA: hypothetical protein R4217_002467 [Enterobacter soli]|nr:hypothetical protein [Enterobacter soli]